MSVIVPPFDPPALSERQPPKGEKITHKIGELISAVDPGTEFYQTTLKAIEDLLAGMEEK